MAASSLAARAALRRAAPALRRRPFVTNMAYNMAKKMMPKISETERVGGRRPLGLGQRGKGSGSQGARAGLGGGGWLPRDERC